MNIIMSQEEIDELIRALQDHGMEVRLPDITDTEMNVKAIELLGGKLMQLNKELSQKMYEENEEDIHLNLCYNNMFNLSHTIYGMNAKIAYGYAETSPQLYVRHAFISCNGEIIDPLRPLWKRENIVGANYIVLKEYETFDEYMEELKKNKRGSGYDVDMRHTLDKSFWKFTDEARPLLRAFFVD